LKDTFYSSLKEKIIDKNVDIWFISEGPA